MHVIVLAISGGGGGDVNESWSVRVCERRFRLDVLQPGGPEERDGTAGAEQEGQHPHPRWSVLNQHSFCPSLALFGMC